MLLKETCPEVAGGGLEFGGAVGESFLQPLTKITPNVSAAINTAHFGKIPVIIVYKENET